ncbi:MAG: threonine/serine dehydratase [Azospirillaceae bacterium]
MPFSTDATPPGVDIAAIEDAARRLAGEAVETPLLESELLNRRVGGRLLVKAEPLQRTGSFKFRGAYTKISRLDLAVRARGVIAFSSGNHAQGVAAAAAAFGIPATIVMPADAPAIKRRNTEALGATVVPYDRWREDREAIGAELVERTGASLVRPYDDPDVIAGQGTVGLEIAARCATLGLRPDAVLVCCGGGGLTAGVATALADRLPGVPVHAVEPEGGDDTARSLAAGERLANPPGGPRLCDALLSPMPGEVTFPINRRLGVTGLVVSEAEVIDAMRAAFEHLKLVLEPGGAVSLAAALSGRVLTQGRTVVAVASGGNVDPATYARCLSAD